MIGASRRPKTARGRSTRSRRGFRGWAGGPKMQRCLRAGAMQIARRAAEGKAKDAIGEDGCDRARRGNRWDFGGAAIAGARARRRRDRSRRGRRRTSYGNTGIVQSEAVFPYVLPRDPRDMARAALNRDPRAQIRYSALPAVLPWLWRYFLASSPKARLARRQGPAPLVSRSVAEHEAFAAAAGAGALLRRTGWIKVFRSERGRQGCSPRSRNWRRSG